MITREVLSEYVYLQQSIEDTKKKIKHYQELLPRTEYDKVRGSSSEFPYTARNFTISGFNGDEDDGRLKKIRRLYAQLVKQSDELLEKKIEIELFIQEIQNLSTRLIFSYLYIDGMTQDEVARKLCLEQCSVSKRVSRYLGSINVIPQHK